MINSKFLYILTLLLLFVSNVFGQLRVSSVFSDNMVLQRDTTTQFWGWAKAGSKVKIKASWSKDSIETITNGNGQWKVDLLTTKAGGPYEIVVGSNNQKIVLSNVFMGEVWLCSGQSNMQWNSTNKLKEMLDILPTIKNNNIRLLNITNVASDYPQDNIIDHWEICDSSSASTISAIGYFFAEKLLENLDVPIGIINSSWGGTCAEVWVDEEIVRNDSILFKDSKTKKVAPRKPNLPGRAFNSMIYPIVGYSIAGVLWYQGEDNVATWSSYDYLLNTLISDWRAKWNNNFPFYYAQIAPYTYKNKDLPRAAYLRESQNKVSISDNGIYMVVTSDLVNDVKDIHPIRKKEVAQRFANIALSKEYKNININPLSPVYKAHVIKGDKVEIEFHNMDNETLVINKGEKLDNIYVSGEDKVFYPAEYKLSGNKLIVYSKNVKRPVAVRYAFSENDLTSLRSSNGLPVSLFRTDNWLQFTN